ncbi:MAG: PSP1 domain-containing protein [Alkalispirochaetaceae bacterium]
MESERFVLVRNDYTGETELCVVTDQEELPPADDLIGSSVIVETRYGDDICRVLGPVSPNNSASWKERRQIIRRATEKDHAREEEHRREARRALEICRERIEYHGLKMQLVGAHFLYDGSKLLFFFTAENRVDFRALVKDLVSNFRTRIELRQIGVREEARMSGGIGVCGRALCCSSVSDKLEPVSIKMAKAQNLSLNSMKISGPCGRLLCCLAYEHRFYEEARRHNPTIGCSVLCEGASCRVVDVNYLSKRLYLSGDDGRYLGVPMEQCRKENGRWALDLRPVDPDIEDDRG